MDRLALLLWGLVFATGVSAHEITFEVGAKSLEARMDGQAIFTYVWQDEKIPRPYFKDVFAPDGTRITRRLPPDAELDKDNMDHPDFHPGIWLAFGDLGGLDFWRNKARVRHVEFLKRPKVEGLSGTFVVRNSYESLDTPPRVVCEETCHYEVTPAGRNGYYLEMESEFTALAPGVYFGDQEEMGLGIRLDTPLSVKHGGGFIENDTGGRNEAGTWGKQGGFCAAGRTFEDKQINVWLMPDSKNFRPSWFHNRDYGLLVANPFGRKSMTAPKDDTVAPDQTLLPGPTTVTSPNATPFRLGFEVYIAYIDPAHALYGKDSKAP